MGDDAAGGALGAGDGAGRTAVDSSVAVLIMRSEDPGVLVDPGVVFRRYW
jgi:hypothetical protein